MSIGRRERVGNRNQTLDADARRCFVRHHGRPHLLTIHELNQMDSQELAKALYPFRDGMLHVDSGLFLPIRVLRMQSP